MPSLTPADRVDAGILDECKQLGRVRPSRNKGNLTMQNNMRNNSRKRASNQCPDQIGQRVADIFEPSDQTPHSAEITVEWWEIEPSPENDKIYGPVDPKDRSIIALAKSIRDLGLRDPIVITQDDYILSGHRRYAACKLAGLKVIRVRIEPIRRSDDIDAFVVLLREFNRQRVKSIDVLLHEAVIDTNPAESRAELISYRQEKSKARHESLCLSEARIRRIISEAKHAMRDAIIEVLNGLSDFWPVSDRQVHYGLLNDPPLRHSSKPGSRYRNDLVSYNDLTDMLTRMRLDGTIPFHSIGDESRLSTVWNVYDSPADYIAKEVDGFLKGYYRNLQKSQPCHIEVLGEKNTVFGILRPVCMEFCLPLTSGKGYCSLPPRHAMSQRFKKSGKDRLVLLMATDFDGDGESIAESFARSMRDDFNIKNITAIKFALNAAQVKSRKLPPVMTAKASSKQTAKFVAKYGSNVWELEALKPTDLQDLLRKAIVRVLDMERFEAEQRAEERDAAGLKAIRVVVQDLLKTVDLTQFTEGGAK